ncbi:alpha/beta hydrolase [Clostridiaceae bacterium OttesenSCG-928-D20]|nr:alpha/beta hydrolase [Clostridiaceae bacterium OttesenSCG-928-D20]
MLYLLIAILVVIALLLLNHHIRLKAESSKIKPCGQMIELDCGRVHVFAQGKKENPRIILMSGSSMPSPVCNYKKLYSKLLDEYRVVVPERFGYGYSDIVDSSRDVKVILEQTRLSLKLAGEKPPYILMPHSMSGIEALLWAQTYPDEILAIIGLDMALPGHYQDMNLDFRTSCYNMLTKFIRNLGLQRLSFLQKALGVYDKATLTPAQWQQERYLIHKVALNRLIYKESTQILQSAQEVAAKNPPNCPMLLFVSDGKVAKTWKTRYEEYQRAVEYAQIINLECSHMMHNECSEEIERMSKEFLNNCSPAYQP